MFQGMKVLRTCKKELSGLRMRPPSPTLMLAYLPRRCFATSVLYSENIFVPPFPELNLPLQISSLVSHTSIGKRSIGLPLKSFLVLLCKTTIGYNYKYHAYVFIWSAVRFYDKIPFHILIVSVSSDL